MHQEDLNANEIHEHVRGIISGSTVHSWIEVINASDTIDLRSPKGCSRIVRTKSLIQKVKQRL